MVGVHRPSYSVANYRLDDHLLDLGHTAQGDAVRNLGNFPSGTVEVKTARSIYEIPNPLAFRGATFIDSGWADARAGRPETIRIPPRPACSLSAVLGQHVGQAELAPLLAKLPRPLKLSLAAASTEAEELVLLAHDCCRILCDPQGQPTGLGYQGQGLEARPEIADFELFETIANNPALPDGYKEIMVLRPGVQGGSEIVGEIQQQTTHIFEYLRSNSYIPHGHYAANFAHDAIRYRTTELSEQDMRGLRHLYYQRTYVVLAEQLDLEVPAAPLDETGMERLRQEILSRQAMGKGGHPATLWGWNFGYDFSGTGYRLHASHQMIHQQYAMVPETVPGLDGQELAAYSCGDLVADQIDQYRALHGRDFFTDYLAAIANNVRMDGRPLPRELVVWQDDRVLLFVPKAQTSQWELQLMVTADQESGQPVGNVVEADQSVRASLDRGMLRAQQIYAGLGAAMVTSIEFSKRMALDNGQRLLYSFLPKLPWSMGAFSEAQSRFILGHYPEDFAAACRLQLSKIDSRE